jgi:hypothetical protein
MNTNKSNINQLQNDRLEQDKKCSYTPRTFGAFPEQLEFDFGPEFTMAASKTEAEINAHETKPEHRNNYAVSKKTRK